MEKTKNSVYKLTLSAVFVALATVLSLIKVVEMPLGGSVTLLSMLPIVIISVAFGLKWGFGSAFVFALGQLALGLAQVLSWGLTPAMLIGTIVFDYIIAFTVLGIVSHFISGYVIFKNLEQFEIFGSLFTNRPILYSLAYNGFYMLPELVITTVAAAIIFRIPAVKKLFA